MRYHLRFLRTAVVLNPSFTRCWFMSKVAFGSCVSQRLEFKIEACGVSYPKMEMPN